MAKTQDDIQRMAMEANGHRQAAKLKAAFGNANCYADGGYAHRTKRYDQTGSPCMADGGYVARPVSYGVKPGRQVFRAADGGMVGAIQAMKGKRDAAIEAAVKGPAKPVTPAAPAKPAEPDDSKIGIIIPKAAPAPAPAPQKGLLQRILGMADGGAAELLRGRAMNDDGSAGSVVQGAAGLTRGRFGPPPATVFGSAGTPYEVGTPVGLTPLAQRVQAEEQEGALNRMRNNSVMLPTMTAPEFSAGGPVRGPGTPTSDSIPAMLSKGEYVLPADTVRAVGKEKLDAIKDATHTPVKARFGNGMVGGGIAGYDVNELTPEYIDYARTPNPSMRSPNLANNVNVGNGNWSQEAQDYAGRSRWQQASPAEAAPATPPPSAPAPEPVAAQAAKPGLMRTMANRAANAGRALAGRPGQVVGTPGQAAGRGLIARTLNPNVGGLLKGAARRVPGLWAPYAVGTGAFHTAAETPEQHQAFAESLGADSPNALTYALEGAKNIGDAATFGYASKIGRGLSAGFNAPASTPGPTSAAGFNWRSAAEGYNDAPARAPDETAGGATAAPPAGANISGGGAQNPNDVTPDQAAGITPEQRAFFGKAGVDSTWQNKGDFGGDGQTIYRKGNSYVGAGGGTNKATGYVPQGVNFGITPDQLAAYKYAQTTQPAQAPQAPQYQHDARIDQVNSQISDLSNKLAGMKPGELGRGAIRHQIATLQGVASTLQGGDQARNTFNEGQFGQANAMFTAAQERAIRERELNFSHNYAWARADLDRQIAGQNFDIRRAEIGNEAHRQLVAEAQQRLGNATGRLESLAKADGGDADLYKVAASTHPFPGSDGKPHLYQDLDEAARAKADGYIQLQASKMKARRDAGLPYSLDDAQTNESPGLLGWARAFLHAPAQSLRFGTTQTGSWLTSRPNVYPSDEAAAADAAQQRARLGTPNHP